jgi:hypothetical protein
MAADLNAQTADISATCKLSNRAVGLVAKHSAPVAYVEQLAREGLAADGLEFVAHWLPKRAAIWWGCLCLWHVRRPTLPAAEEAALRALVQWVRDPSETRRRALDAVAAAAGHMRTPAGGLACAAFFSGGSLAPPGLPVVAPPPDLTAHTVAQVLGVAALHTHSARAGETHRHFLELGLEVARGENRWN